MFTQPLFALVTLLTAAAAGAAPVSLVQSLFLQRDTKTISFLQANSSVIPSASVSVSYSPLMYIHKIWSHLVIAGYLDKFHD